MHDFQADRLRPGHASILLPIWLSGPVRVAIDSPVADTCTSRVKGVLPETLGDLPREPGGSAHAPGDLFTGHRVGSRGPRCGDGQAAGVTAIAPARESKSGRDVVGTGKGQAPPPGIRKGALIGVDELDEPTQPAAEVSATLPPAP